MWSTKFFLKMGNFFKMNEKSSQQQLPSQRQASSQEGFREEWIWIGFNEVHAEARVHKGESGGIYINVAYHPAPATKDCFKRFVTLPNDNDIKELDTLFHSPSAGHFIKNYGEVFYADDQGCVIWALEKKTRRVYVYDQSKKKSTTRKYVAKTLGEFLTRMQWECMECDKKFDEMLRNLPKPTHCRKKSW